MRRPYSSYKILYRYVTATCFLDYDTIAVGDKFGSVAILRLSDDVNDEIEEDPTGAKAFWDRGLLNGASQKVCEC